MSEQENLNIIKKVIDGFNSHNLEATVQPLANDVRSEATGSTKVMDKQQTREYNQRFMDAFPDMHFDIKDTISQGDRAALFWSVTGTHTKPLKSEMGPAIPPTNKSVRVSGVTYLEIHNGLVARQQVYWDQIDFLTQLGLVTPQTIAAMLQR